MTEQASKPTMELFQKAGIKPPIVTKVIPKSTRFFFEILIAICPAIKVMIKAPKPGSVDKSWTVEIGVSGKSFAIAAIAAPVTEPAIASEAIEITPIRVLILFIRHVAFLLFSIDTVYYELDGGLNL